MRVEGTGRKVLSVERATSKRWSSGKIKDGRERFVAGVWRKAGERVTTTGWEETVEFETRSRESEGGRKAAEAIVAAETAIPSMTLIVTFDRNLTAFLSLPEQNLCGGNASNDGRHPTYTQLKVS